LSSKAKQVLLWLMIISSALVFVWYLQTKQQTPPKEISFDVALTQIRNKDIKQVTIKQDTLDLVNKADAKFTAKLDGSEAARNQIYAAKEGTDTVVNLETPSSGLGWLMLVNALPFILLMGFLAFTLRQMQAGGNKALSFGKSKAKLLNNQQKRVTFKDVAGVDEAKEELQEIIEFLKDPQKFQKLGGKIPKGVLMVGPPGTGKTLLAKAVAGEANVPFFSISGSDFVEMFVGVGASRVRDLFEQGKKNAPCIIFIDEIDAVDVTAVPALAADTTNASRRSINCLSRWTVLSLTTVLSSLPRPTGRTFLTPALLRPGRFDRRVVVGRPDVRGREGILKVHTRKIPLDEAVDVSVIARGTPGFTGADLANIVNEAALNAARFNQKVVTMSDFEIAKDKVMMGAERKSMVISDEEKKITAYHEAGHTMVGLKVPNSDPVHKVTIIPRGMALGVTMYLPEKDRLSANKEFLLGQIASAMGGRIAEELFIGSITTGASNDIERATEIARAMVCEYGMSDLGPLTFGKKEEQIFLGREIAQHRDYSEDTAIKIDKEVQKIIGDQYARAKKILDENRESLIMLAEALLE
jgi:cell division protease FtsH